jgi:hypothetical protein
MTRLKKKNESARTMISRMASRRTKARLLRVVLGQKIKDPNKALKNFERISADATLWIFFGIVLEIGILILVWFCNGKNGWEIFGSITANALIGYGLIREYVVLLRAMIATGAIKRQSDRKVAEANDRAAKADLARVELEKQLAPRMLNQEQWDLIQSFKGKFETINIAYETDAEAWWFATELQKAFMFAGITSAMFSRDPSVHSFSIMIFEPLGFDGSRAKTVGPLIELFSAKQQLPYGTAAIIGGLPTDVLKHAGDDEKAAAFLQRTPMVIVGGRFIVPPSHWPRPKAKTGAA